MTPPQAQTQTPAYRSEAPVTGISSSQAKSPLCVSEAHVVLLVNFVAPNMRGVFQEISRRVGRLTILSSVAVESNRHWNADWGELDVIVQKTWTITRHPKHPGGYRDVNYIHVPLDTISQLKRLRGDVIVSLELGARSFLSTVYRKLHPNCAHLIAVNASERSEAGRGRIRERLRRRLLPRADWVTYNGPSCRHLLLALGADEAAMSPWNYAADPSKPYRGPLTRGHANDRRHLSLLTVGVLSERKGVIQAVRQLSSWAAQNPERTIDWNLVGAGPLESHLRQYDRPSNLRLHFHGFCEPEAIRDHYRDNDVLLFPTLADEWGLVVDESLCSGLPVIGSCHAQAVTTLVRDGENGMTYNPEVEESLSSGIDRLMAMPDHALHAMPTAARESVSERTPANSADQFATAVTSAIDRRWHAYG
jgi:glycosyltransferase involved in cell wall biosynthesis